MAQQIPSSLLDSMALEELVEELSRAVQKRLKEGASTSPSAAASGRADAAQSVKPTGLIDERLASMIDHTLLKPDATVADVEKLCAEAARYHFATVCINPSHVARAVRLLEGATTKVITVVGFPLGATTSASKAFEAREAVAAGAGEIDMVINVGALKARDYALVFEDIRQVVEASKPVPVKVILETSTLTDEQKIIASALSKAAGAAFVKTSTGFSSGGATATDVELMRKVVGPELGVKASGGIRTREDALKMIAAGANRIGASASVAIVTATADSPRDGGKGGAY